MASTYLTRTQTAGNRRKGTFSAWIKRSALAYNYLMSWNSTTSGTSLGDWIRFNGDRLDVIKYTGSVVYRVQTNRLFRDTAAWYHIVVAYDSEQSTASNRIKIYVNGVQETSFETSTYPSEDYDFEFNNNNIVACVGKNYNTEANFNGSMAMMEWVDGQQLTPAYFGSTDSNTGIWTPTATSTISDYGTNGFKLAMDTTTPGADTSGKSNTFTASGTPTLLQGNPQNNWCTLNPLNSTGNGTEPTYANGNTQSSSPSSGGGYVGSSTIGVTNGKWFWEFKKSGGSATNIYNGIGNELGTAELARQSAVGVYFGNQVFYRPDGTKQIVTNGSNANSSYGASWTTNDIIGIALDLNSATNTVTFYKDGASQGAINLPTNTDTWFFNVVCGTDTVDTWQLNFGEGFFGTTAAGTNADGNGQGLFAYAVPSGYYALNTKNLEAYG